FLAAVLDNIEGHLRALRQRTKARPFHRRDMDEYVFTSAAIWLNKPVTLGRIEPLHCSARHVALPDKIATVKLERQNHRRARENCYGPQRRHPRHYLQAVRCFAAAK